MSLFAAERVNLKTSPEDENSNSMFVTIKIRLISLQPTASLSKGSLSIQSPAVVPNACPKQCH